MSGPPLPASQNWNEESIVAFANFGFGLASAGDVNQDGYGDLIVGAPFSSIDGFSRGIGAAYVIFGKSGGFGTIDLATFNPSNPTNDPATGFVIHRGGNTAPAERNPRGSMTS